MIYKRRSIFVLGIAIGLAWLASGVVHADAAVVNKPLRVCAAQDAMPYSNQDEQGFENEIARILGEALDRPVEFIWADQPAIYLVSEYLNQKRCDVVMGVDTNDPRVLTTQPYYTSSYVFIYRKDRDLDITSWKSEDLQKLDRFAVSPYGPAVKMLQRIGKWKVTSDYVNSLTPAESPYSYGVYVRLEPQRVVSEVVRGKADVGIMWGPAVARYVKKAPVPLAMVPMPKMATAGKGDPVKMHYSQSLAVRKGETKLLESLNQALDESAAEIRAVLEDEGMPLVASGGDRSSEGSATNAQSSDANAGTQASSNGSAPTADDADAAGQPWTATVEEPPVFRDMITGQPFDLSDERANPETEAAAKFLATAKNPYRGDPEAIKRGGNIFLTACAGCHGHHAEGKIGPALNDDYWSYYLNANAQGLFESIWGGLTMMMGPHKDLGVDKILKIMAWIRDINPDADSEVERKNKG